MARSDNSPNATLLSLIIIITRRSRSVHSGFVSNVLLQQSPGVKFAPGVKTLHINLASFQAIELVDRHSETACAFFYTAKQL